MEEMVPKEGSVAEAMEAQAEIARKIRQAKRAEIRTGFAEPIIFWVFEWVGKVVGFENTVKWGG